MMRFSEKILKNILPISMIYVIMKKISYFVSALSGRKSSQVGGKVTNERMWTYASAPFFCPDSGSPAAGRLRVTQHS